MVSKIKNILKLQTSDAFVYFFTSRQRELLASESAATRPTPSVVGVDARLTTFRNLHARSADIQLLRPVHVSVNAFSCVPASITQILL